MTDTPLRLVFTAAGDNGRLKQPAEELTSKLEHLCKTAGLLGDIRLIPIAHKGKLPRVSGMHIFSPTARGVPVLWRSTAGQYKKVLLRVRKDMQVNDLYALLKSSLKAQNTTEEKEKIMHDGNPDVDAVLTKILNASVPAPVSGSSDDLYAKRGTGPMATLMRNTENIELFLLEIASKANQDGEVAATDCLSVLRVEFNFPSTGNSASSALYQFTQRKVLEKISGGYRIPADKFLELRTDKSKGIETASVETDVAEVVLTPVVEPTELEKKFEALSERVKSRRSHHQRWLDLTQERLEVMSTLEHLEAHKSALERDITAIASGLEDPKAKEDEAAYDAIMQLLNR